MARHQDTFNTLNKIASERIILLDGAMGTMIQKYNLQEEDFRGTRFADHPVSIKGNNDLLSLTQPEVITEIHYEYFKAGADIVETNTFNAQCISLADYGMEELSFEINKAAVQCAAAARDRYYQEFGDDHPKFIAGAIGPTNRTASLSPDVNDPAFRAVSFDDLVAAYREQALGLIAEGVDILLVETIFDTLNAKAAFFALTDILEENNLQIPLMASGTITDASGRTLSGQTPEAFAISLAHVPLFSIGFNCALGADQLLPHIEGLAANCSTLISAYPNAGLPNALGAYDQTPQIMAELMRPYLDAQLVNILGGCCGSTPEHIAALKDLSANYTPRKIHF